MASLLGAKHSPLEGGRALDKVSGTALLARVAAAFGVCAIIAEFLKDSTPVLLPKLSRRNRIIVLIQNKATKCFLVVPGIIL